MRNKTVKEKRDESIRRILDAATAVFAQVGFAGARVDEIARRAGVNKATIYYHIGDKEALYARVLHDVFADTATRIANNIRASQSPEEKLKTYIRNLALTIDQHPHVPPIMMREFALGGQNFPEVVTADFARIFRMLQEILEEGSQKGLFIDVSPFTLHAMVIGPVIFCRNLNSIRSKLSHAPEILRKLDSLTSSGVADEIENVLLRAVKKEENGD